ncbi:MAG TPA: SDR family oxidoreductase [Verrucomicrobiae bacterium]|nr:SDR family oxidoreductase [Verrucomicrobiae bacterium]
MSATETVLITGASSGIGLELARCFARDGCRLILVARNQIALEKLAADLRQENKIETIVLPADLSLPETPKQIYSKLAAQNIFPDILVNNAGFGLHGRFAELPLPTQMEIIRVNVSALVELTGLFLPPMIQHKRGGVLNVGSVAGFIPGPGMAIYYATKAFVQSFTEALAEELLGTGITVTALDPGPTESNFGNIARGTKVRRIQSGKISAESVAKYGYHAFRCRKVIAIPGVRNRILILLTRLAPRWAIRKGIKSYNKFKD